MVLLPLLQGWYFLLLVDCRLFERKQTACSGPRERNLYTILPLQNWKRSTKTSMRSFQVTQIELFMFYVMLYHILDLNSLSQFTLQIHIRAVYVLSWKWGEKWSDEKNKNSMLKPTRKSDRISVASPAGCL